MERERAAATSWHANERRPRRGLYRVVYTTSVGCWAQLIISLFSSNQQLRWLLVVVIRWIGVATVTITWPRDEYLLLLAHRILFLSIFDFVYISIRMTRRDMHDCSHALRNSVIYPHLCAEKNQRELRGFALYRRGFCHSGYILWDFWKRVGCAYSIVSIVREECCLGAINPLMTVVRGGR